MPPAKHVVIATIGSLGDLHPCLALALELGRRGHSVTLATTAYYRTRIEALGLGFHPIRPDFDPTDSAIIARCADLRTGLKVLYREMILPFLSATYDDLLACARDADLLIAGELVYAAPLVAEKLDKRWASIILSPLSFFSAQDPSFTANAPSLIHLRKLGAPVYRLALEIGKLATRHWSNPVRELRGREGLRRECDPVFHDKFSPDLVLALYSRFFAPKQPDWPPQTLQPGFVRFVNSTGESHELREFLRAGEPPIVFTQGSTAVHNPGDFYQQSAAAARLLGKRALLIGAPQGLVAESDDLLRISYANYSQVFAHALVNVHQGGSGTIGEALRAGKPMLVVPYGWDQPDNARRIERLGVGLHLPRQRYSEVSAERALRTLIQDQSYRAGASKVRDQLQSEDGLRDACNAIEALL